VIQLPSLSFRLIEAERAQHPVSVLCAVLGVTRAGYYAWRSAALGLVSAKTRSSRH
jgi:putative transposase